MTQLVGLTGHARVGKDSIGQFLAKYGYERRSFADGVRDALYALDPNLSCADSLKSFIDERGWEAAKELPEVRGLLQRMGTEVGRNMFGPNVWVGRVANNLPEKCVITDVRFYNEAEFVREKGLLVHVYRPGYGPVNGHISDAGLPVDALDYTIFNDGGLRTLEHLTKTLAEEMDDLFPAHGQTEAVLGRIDEALA